MDELTIKLGDQEIAVCKGTTIETPTVLSMEYYYRRGNKRFFRNKLAKLIVEANGEVPLKRGETYEIEINERLGPTY
jgi:hypothetical protein